MPSGGQDMPSYYAREDDRSGLRVIRDTDSINASYDRYLRSAVCTFAICFLFVDPICSFVDLYVLYMMFKHTGSLYQQMQSLGGDSGRSMSSGLGGNHLVDDQRALSMGGSDPAGAAKTRPIGVGGRPEIPLPPDASSTLFVEGLPANCSRREVARILFVV